MKRINITLNHVGIMIMILISTLISCSSGDSNDIQNEINTIDATAKSTANLPYCIKFKVIDSEGNDITTKGDMNNVDIYIFNKENQYCCTINVDKAQIINRKEIYLNYNASDEITAVALGGINAENETVLTPNTLEDLEISLNNIQGALTNASDLFYGKVKLNRTTTKSDETKEIQMTRKSSTISLNTKNLVKYYGSKSGNYVYKVKNIKKSLNYDGALSGNSGEYSFTGYFNSNDELVTGDQVILGGSEITVELYKDGNLIFSKNLDKNGDMLSIKKGKRVEMYFNYSSNTYASIYVADWSTLIQIASVG